MSTAPARRRRLGRALRVLPAAALLLVSAALAEAPPQRSPEHEIKAAFLFHFAQFVEWPRSAFPAPESPLTFCVLGDAALGTALEEMARGEAIGGRPLVVRQARQLDAPPDCHLIFVGRAEQRRTPELLSAVAGRPVLTVGEVTDFGRRGGTINFYLDEDRVRFEINPEAASRHGLHISSELLSLGRLVASERTGEASS